MEILNSSTPKPTKLALFLLGNYIFAEIVFPIPSISHRIHLNMNSQTLITELNNSQIFSAKHSILLLFLCEKLEVQLRACSVEDRDEI